MVNLANNKGSNTPGITSENIDGTSLNSLDKIKIKKYRFSPFRRKMIPKPKKPNDPSNAPTKMRPLGVPEWQDLIVQEALRLILNAIYERIFHKMGSNFGFWPKLSCNHAIKKIELKSVGHLLCLEGDIKGAYDNVNFVVLQNI